MANGKSLAEMSREELIEQVKSLKKQKKFGLVWEDKPEDVVVQCQTELPVLEEVKDREIEKLPGDRTNVIIEGDNYHALSVLNYTHAGKVDVIYIDPPYNTGAKDWKYNNDYVDGNDGYRHSKWLSMMKNRLSISKSLLRKDGIFICAIDDNELATTILLLNEIFPEKIINNVVVVNNPHGVARSGFSRTHEYALFLLNSGQTVNKKPAPEDIRNINLRRSGNNSLRKDSPTMFYPIFVNKKTLKVIGVGDVPKESFHPKQPIFERNSYFELWPIDVKGVEKNWYYSKKRVAEKGDKELRCKWIKGSLQLSFYHTNGSEQTYKSVWSGSEFDSGSYGATLVKNLTSNNFPFPKSINTVYDCLRAVLKRKDAIIIDFFAGSGTTGHAVMMLNKEDDGNRQFILCTNNENGIAEEVTYPRIKNVIEGYADVEGIPANVRYFKTAFVKSETVSDDTRRELVARSTEMICVKEDTYGKEYDNKHFKIYSNAKQTTGILFDLDAIEDFKEKLRKKELPTSIYVFSLSNDTFDADFDDLGLKHKLCPIPESILEVYRKLFTK